MESVASISLLFEENSSLATIKIFIKQPGKFYIFMNFTIWYPNLHVKRVSLVPDVKEE